MRRINDIGARRDLRRVRCQSVAAFAAHAFRTGDPFGVDVVADRMASLPAEYRRAVHIVRRIECSSTNLFRQGTGYLLHFLFTTSHLTGNGK